MAALEQVKNAVAEQIQAGLAFRNLHGITPENVQSFLVEPYLVTVDPDDLESEPRSMWVVLHERPHPRDGYVVVFDPHDACWGVAEFSKGPVLTLVVSAPNLAEALSAM